MTKSIIYFFDSQTNQFKRKLELPVEKLNYSKVPSGTKIVIVLSSKKLFFVEIDSLKVFHTETLTSEEVWQYYFIGTNKFMTEKTVDGKKTYTSYSFDIKSDPRVCSKTCNGKCDGKNFYQCPLFPHIFYTMIWGSIIILLLAILVWAFLISKKNYQQS